MRRRAVIGGIGAALAAAPFGAPAQQQRPPARLGYIWIGKRGSGQSTLQGLRHGLREFGYVEGRDYVLEERYADSQPERLPSIVAELVGLPVSMILSPGVPVTQAVTKGTASIPVLATVPDLVASGFVESLARPGGNVTGISLQAGVALSEKWLELLKETFPHVRKVAVLAISPSSPYIDRIAEVGPVLAVEPVVYSAKDSDELERALLAIATNLPDGLVVAPDATLISNRARMVEWQLGERVTESRTSTVVVTFREPVYASHAVKVRHGLKVPNQYVIAHFPRPIKPKAKGSNQNLACATLFHTFSGAVWVNNGHSAPLAPE